MTTKDAFTQEELARLERAPIVATMAITLADPGGPIEAVKESMAGIKTVQEAAQSSDQPELIREITASVTEKVKARQSPLKDFRPKGALAGQEILDELRAAAATVAQKGTPEEAAAFRELLLTSAQRAADAAKEGGFMGFKAERVSEGEQAMLDKLREALAA